MTRRAAAIPFCPRAGGIANTRRRAARQPASLTVPAMCWGYAAALDACAEVFVGLG
jgi:hypothetical protein